MITYDICFCAEIFLEIKKIATFLGRKKCHIRLIGHLIATDDSVASL